MAPTQRTRNSRPGLLRRLWRIMTQRFTIMLIPHSERSVLNFHVNALVLVFVGVVFAGVLGSFIYLSSVHIGSTAIIEDQDREISERQANLDAVVGEVQNLLRSGRAFDEELVDTINSLGIERPDSSVPAAVTRGDLASFFDIQAVTDGQT